MKPETCYQLPATNYLLPTTRYQLPATNYLLPTTCYQLPATNYQLPATNYQLSKIAAYGETHAAEGGFFTANTAAAVYTLLLF